MSRMFIQHHVSKRHFGLEVNMKVCAAKEKLKGKGERLCTVQAFTSPKVRFNSVSKLNVKLKLPEGHIHQVNLSSK